MDLIKEALSMGFADAAIMDTKDLVFVPEYRQFCEDNLCGNYNLVPACPPACGTVEEMQAKALSAFSYFNAFACISSKVPQAGGHAGTRL